MKHWHLIALNICIITVFVEEGAHIAALMGLMQTLYCSSEIGNVYTMLAYLFTMMIEIGNKYAVYRNSTNNW
jgi:cell shape-determining protein MreD